MSSVLKTIASVSSIRGYDPAALPEETVRTLIETALQAPTARNEQEIHVSVVPGNHPVLQELQNDLNPNAQTSWYYGAPVVLFLSGKDDFSWSELDAGIACQNVHLAACEMGLGSIQLGCVKGILTGEKKAEYNQKLQIPEGYSFRIAVAFGKPTVTKEPHTINFDRDVSCL